MYYEHEKLHENAMELFRDSGLTAASMPLFVNHSFKQAVYVDSEKTVFVERGLLKCASEISHLFDLGDDVFEDEAGEIISFYSVALRCSRHNRSQMAHDVHVVLHASFTSPISVILFHHEGEIILSIAGVDDDIILSEWYHLFWDYDYIVQLLNAGQYSFNSAHEFITDLIYVVARKYYLTPILNGLAVYSIIPDQYFGNGLFEENRDDDIMPIRDFIVQYSLQNQQIYGDDYVESTHGTVRDMSAIDNELARLIFELELEEEQDDNHEESDEDNIETDEYEYNDVDPEIFKDPTLLLKWLNNGN